ncbi:hypothetical protein ACFX19_044310 [Malus domestica]
MTSIEELKNDGLMTTHYQETKAYFRNTKVRSFLCPRNPDEGKSETVTMFSHHQKTVVVDSEISGGGSQRRIANLKKSQFSLYKICFRMTTNHGTFNCSDPSTSCFCFPEKPLEATKMGLVSRKNNIIDRSIQNAISLAAYLGDIRDEDINVLHLIMKELSVKIVSKIEVGERFIVYIVVPMWPKGTPESASSRAILDWQRRTTEMDGEYKPLETPELDTDYKRAQQARLGDEYIIIGYANINQKSMDGARDSKIAIGAFQPNHLASTIPARAQMYAFRLALWYEHLKIVEKNWEFYLSDTCYQDLPGHLLHYPTEVSKNRALTTLPGFEYFPDTKARVFSTKSKYILPILTT